MKFKVYKYESLPSTNDRAIQFIKDKNVKFGYIHSEMQTSGRGAHGKRWVSIKGNYFGSIFFPADFFITSTASSVINTS